MQRQQLTSNGVYKVKSRSLILHEWLVAGEYCELVGVEPTTTLFRMLSGPREGDTVSLLCKDLDPTSPLELLAECAGEDA